MVSVPLVGSEVMITDWRVLAGLSFGSKVLPTREAKSEPLVAKLKVVSSLMVLALSAPTGWLLTAVMFRVMVAGPEVLLPVAPVSVTVNVKVGAVELPLFLSAAGVKRSWPALSWDTETVVAPVILV